MWSTLAVQVSAQVCQSPAWQRFDPMGREEIGRWLAFLRPSSNAVELQLSKVPIEDVDQQELSESFLPFLAV